MLKYRLSRPRVAFTVLTSCYRHTWYVVPQMVILALADRDLEDRQKELMAQMLHSLPRQEIKTGKPDLEVKVDWSGWEVKIPDMSDLVTSDSWLIFDLLGLTGPQVYTVQYTVQCTCTV